MRKRERENPCRVCSIQKGLGPFTKESKSSCCHDRGGSGYYHWYEEEVCGICGHQIPALSKKTSIQVSTKPINFLASYENGELEHFFSIGNLSWVSLSFLLFIFILGFILMHLITWFTSHHFIWPTSIGNWLMWYLTDTSAKNGHRGCLRGSDQNFETLGDKIRRPPNFRGVFCTLAVIFCGTICFPPVKKKYGFFILPLIANYVAFRFEWLILYIDICSFHAWTIGKL